MAEMDPIQLKESGNEFFQNKDYDKAIDCYTKAIQLTKEKKVLATLYRNRAACYLKKENYVPAASDASKAIDVDASDIKALFRRSQALEKLGKLDQAFKDAQRCATMEPKNKMFQETLQRLNHDIQEKLKIQFSTDSRVERMFEVLLDENVGKERKEKAANNLIVLAREDAGAERIFRNNGLNLLLQLIETKKPEMMLAAIRTLSGMCSRHKSRALAVMHFVELDKICSLMALDNEEIALATSSLFQTILDNFEGKDSKEHHGKDEALVLDTSKDVKMVITRLLEMLVHPSVSGHGRDQALNLLIRNVPRKDLAIKDNTKSLETIDLGLKKILKVGGQFPEMPNCLPLTENTCLTASILLNKLYCDLRDDQERANFRKICEGYVTSKFDPKNMDKNLHAIQCVSALLQGPFDVGNSILALQGVMEMMVALCGSDREIDQMVALEAIIHAASKASRAGFIITNGITLLKDMYKKSTNEKIKIRALVSADKTILYAVASVLVNCTNSYDVKEKIPELVELAKLSKQHVPEDHPKDKKDFVMQRVKRLIKAGVVSALAVMLKADSAILTDQTKELMARVFLALVEDVRDRGKIVAQGGGKSLLPLALHGTDVGKVKASHALAKIAAISDPEIAFPGERIYEVVRPLVSLLNTELDGLQNYEALMGLTNLSAKSEKLRQKIIKEKALPEIECYMYEEHDQIRQAATECMCNMVISKEVQERFMAEGNDRLKLMILLCGEDEVKLQRAGSGALATLTASHKELCQKLTTVTAQWLEILQRLCLHDNVEVQHRGLVIVLNLMEADKEIAKKLIESELLEILTMIGKMEDNAKNQNVINVARECLVKAMDYSLIKPTSQHGK
ncbi:protein unc-45 homolog B isoform X2 [Pristis pectinata]|uniref:protein unc-45 homolog B isoform X2 n=1 Tax=Pristis pectinata TaxID=685728 RepID=UPI00223E0057|nr:protein unc-45 homolog B isoform X2 [Pristis pectinata]